MVPKRESCFDPSGQNTQLFIRTCRRLCALKIVGFHGGKIFIVPKLVNRLKYVPHRLLSRKNGSKRLDSAPLKRGEKAFSNDADDVQIVGQRWVDVGPTRWVNLQPKRALIISGLTAMSSKFAKKWIFFYLSPQSPPPFFD